MKTRNFVLAWTLCELAHGGLAGAQAPSVGLSSVRARTFDNEDLIFFVPEPYDYFASVVASGDFNGDGADDLATGIPYDDGIVGSGCLDCGAVVVRYGVAGQGLEAGLADDFLSQQYAGSLDPAEPGELFGAALAAGDFNGDGIDDLAVGIPMDYGYLPFYRAGAVQIHYGGPGGIQLVGEHFLQPGSNGVPLAFEGYGPALFGGAVAAGDFNADGYDELVVGIPDQHGPDGCGGSFCAYWTTGAVLVARGGVGGVMPFDGFYMIEGEQGLPDAREDGDKFGQSVAAADFNGDGFDDLAIGVPQEDGVGAVLTVFGSPFSLNFANHLFLGEFDLGQPVELDDRFGHTLAAGDFDGDGRDDLAIGTPYEDLSTVSGFMVDAGAVTVLYGHELGFELDRTLYFDQGFGDPLSEGSFAQDAFGWALAAGDFDEDGRDDLAIGHHGENVGNTYDSGGVTVTLGSPWGLVFGRTPIAQGIAGFPGVPPLDDHVFGYALAAGDFDGDGVSDLAVGAPNEDVGGLVSVGTEMVIYGSLFSDGFDHGSASFWVPVVEP